MSTQQTWPDGVIARYLTVGGATVDIREKQDDYDESASDYVAACTGCPSNFGVSKSDWNLQVMVLPWAQSHAEKCRAMPRPEATQ